MCGRGGGVWWEGWRSVVEGVRCVVRGVVVSVGGVEVCGREGGVWKGVEGCGKGIGGRVW